MNRFLNLKFSYAVILLSLISWALFAYFTMSELINSQKAYGKIINKSGKQRMLSQKTALTVNKIVHYQNKKDIKELNDLVRAMKDDHFFLLENLTSDHMKNIYFKEPYNLDNDVKRYFKLLENFIETSDETLLTSINNYSSYLLPKLDHAVNEFEKESNENTSKLKEKESFILLGTLLTLFIEVLFIIMPVLRITEEAKKKMQNFNTQLKEEVDKNIKQIQKGNELFELYFNTVNSLIVALDNKANITMINKFGCDLLGYEKSELLGQNWFDLGVMPKNEHDRVKDFFNKIVSGEISPSNSSFENELASKDGDIKTLTWSNSLIKENNKITGVLSSGIDITNEKKQEHIISEQTKLSAMGEMIGNIAHQWRQPLSVISTAATGLQLKKELNMLDDDFLIKTLQEVDNHAQYLSKTIDTFRNFLLEEKVLKEVVLQERINKALEIVGTALKNNYIDIINNIDQTEPVKVKLVVGELSQVIINLLNNSKDAIKENKIQNGWVKIDLSKNNSDKVEITVEDNGGGIPEDIIPRIFEPYFTTKEKSQGTGLGLHMSHKIISESLKGNIYAQNTKNGARFTIELPLDQN